MRIITKVLPLLFVVTPALAQSCPADHPNARQVQDYTKAVLARLVCPTDGTACSFWPIYCQPDAACPKPVTETICLSDAELQQSIAPPAPLTAPK